MPSLLKHLRHACSFEAVAVDHPRINLFGGTLPATTTILWRCHACGTVDSTTVAGRWTLEQVRGERAEPAEENAVPAGGSAREDDGRGR